MKKQLLIAALFFCATMSFAQENRNEVAFSVGDNMFYTKLSYSENDRKGYGSYTLSYLYRIKKWFWFGAYANVSPIEYTYNYYDYNGYYYDVSNTKKTITRMSLAPSIRFSYLNKPNATLYSGFSLGWGLKTAAREETDLNVFFQITFLGFSVGEKLFIGGEMGMGTKGLFCANVGYRF